MKKAPGIYDVEHLHTFFREGTWTANDRAMKWVPSRPVGYFSLYNRIKLAWGVFTGKYDALRWPGGQ